MRVTAIVLAAVIFAAPAFADKKKTTGPVFEPNTYRFGGTYSVLDSRSASQCSSTCGQDSRCLAWSFVDTPGAARKNSCELKSTIGRSENNPTATSGLSPRIEKRYQPSPYRDASTLLGAQVTPKPAMTKRVQTTSRRAPAQNGPVLRGTPTKRAALPKAAPKRIAAPAAPATITASKPPLRKTPAAPVKISAGTPALRKAPPAPAVISSAPPKPKAPAAVPVSATPENRSQPITLNTPAKPSVKPEPQVQFQPLKRSSDGSYKPTAPKPAAAKKPTSRVVLTGPKGADVAKSVDGRVVLTGDLAGSTGGGVGETPAAPLPRNVPVSAQGERVPYKDLSSREYPDYSVTRAAEQGEVESVGGEAGS